MFEVIYSIGSWANEINVLISLGFGQYLAILLTNPIS